jgi:hypothetical protein
VSRYVNSGLDESGPVYSREDVDEELRIIVHFDGCQLDLFKFERKRVWRGFACLCSTTQKIMCQQLHLSENPPVRKFRPLRFNLSSWTSLARLSGMVVKFPRQICACFRGQLPGSSISGGDFLCLGQLSHARFSRATACVREPFASIE